MDAEALKFKRAFIGYKKSDVDLEFKKLLAQVEHMVDNQGQLETQLGDLTNERNELSRSVITMGTQVVQLEQSLAMAQATSDNLRTSVESHIAEKNAVIETCDRLRLRDKEYSLREREFDELQRSVTSIMSVTKRATDRLFQRAVDNQEHVVEIAGEAASEIAGIRTNVAGVRNELNAVLDELQDKIDRIDESLTNAVHKLVSIKHDNGLNANISVTDVNAEVERLLSMRAGEVDYAGGAGYAVPVLGPYSTKFLSDVSKSVTKRYPPAPGSTKLPAPSFSVTERSMAEANRLLESGGIGYGGEGEGEQSSSAETEQSGFQRIGFAYGDDTFGGASGMGGDSSDIDVYAEESGEQFPEEEYEVYQAQSPQEMYSDTPSGDASAYTAGGVYSTGGMGGVVGGTGMTIGSSGGTGTVGMGGTPTAMSGGSTTSLSGARSVGAAARSAPNAGRGHSMVCVSAVKRKKKQPKKVCIYSKKRV